MENAPAVPSPVRAPRAPRRLAAGQGVSFWSEAWRIFCAAPLIWILILCGQVAIKGLSLTVTSRLFRLGLFWHFLDIAWVGIFSIVYLPGLM